MSDAGKTAAKNLLKKHNLSGYNKPKRTPDHPKKSHMVMAKEGDKTKLIRFGEQGASTAGSPKAGESERMKKKRKKLEKGGVLSQADDYFDVYGPDARAELQLQTERHFKAGQTAISVKDAQLLLQWASRHRISRMPSSARTYTEDLEKEHRQ